MRETGCRTLFLFKKVLYKAKAKVSNLYLIYFGKPPLGHTIKTNITFHTVSLKIYSTLFFQIHHILRMIFEKKKCFSRYILLTDWISLPGSFYFLRYQTIYVLQLFDSSLRRQTLTLTFFIKPFFYITKTSG